MESIIVRTAVSSLESILQQAPKEAFNTIYDRLRKSAERCHEITLVIEEHYPKPKAKELSNFEMGTQILAQMDGRLFNL